MIRQRVRVCGIVHGSVFYPPRIGYIIRWNTDNTATVEFPNGDRNNYYDYQLDLLGEVIYEYRN